MSSWLDISLGTGTSSDLFWCLRTCQGFVLLRGLRECQPASVARAELARLATACELVSWDPSHLQWGLSGSDAAPRYSNYTAGVSPYRNQCPEANVALILDKQTAEVISESRVLSQFTLSELNWSGFYVLLMRVALERRHDVYCKPCSYMAIMQLISREALNKTWRCVDIHCRIVTWTIWSSSERDEGSHGPTVWLLHRVIEMLSSLAVNTKPAPAISCEEGYRSLPGLDW
jgi:hypothetical protein